MRALRELAHVNHLRENVLLHVQTSNESTRGLEETSKRVYSTCTCLHDFAAPGNLKNLRPLVFNFLGFPETQGRVESTRVYSLPTVHAFTRYPFERVYKKDVLLLVFPGYLHVYIHVDTHATRLTGKRVHSTRLRVYRGNLKI